MDKPTAGLRKRQQILQANQVMFLSVAGISVVVGFSVVLMIFLVQRIWFGEQVLAEKNTTIATLEKNISTASELKDNVRVLNTNESLMATRLNDTDSALQSVLDALPADANSTAMASSLQTKLLTGVPGVTIESLKVDPVSGLEVSEESVSSGDSSDPASGTIGFSFAVSAAGTNQEGLRQILLRIEKSIRPFTIKNLTIESQGTRVVMSANGVGYYEPEQSIELKEKVMRP
jgi:hypothetical protein